VIARPKLACSHEIEGGTGVPPVWAAGAPVQDRAAFKMDSRARTAGTAMPPSRAPSYRKASLAILLVVLPSLHAWQTTLAPATPGPFPEPPPFQAEFRIGWSEIDAARAHASLTHNATDTLLTAGGGTTGLARRLYQLDAVFHGRTDRATLHTRRSDLVENYSTRSLVTLVEGRDGNLRSLREWRPARGKASEWKQVKVAPVRDLFAGMLFIRSQPLAKGDTVRLLMFPGGAAFLVDIESRGPETITLEDAPRDALRLDLEIQRVNTKKGNTLEPHSKFRSGKIWLSNDPDRLPLRAEVDIFIGYVFAEITALKKNTPHPTKPAR
jgi:hypothetical protein